MNNFEKIQFGYASAEVEAARDPNLLLQAFYDRAGTVDKIIRGDEFLILGPKGSGKSAIGERIRLLSASDPLLFTSHSYLSDFPYNSFKKVSSGGLEAESKFPTTWAYLILLRLLDSLSSDHGLRSSLGSRFESGLGALRKLGALPANNLKSLVLSSSKASFKAQIPQIIEGTIEATFSGQDLAMIQLVDYLWMMLKSVKTSSRHLFIIDGLDDILTRNEIQYQALAALVLEVSRINNELRACRINAKIVLLIRTDLYERLPGPNKNKWRRDSALTLNWYHDTRDPSGSALVELVNLRAELSFGHKVNVFREYFPRALDGRASINYLLDLTRHTPRDVIQLMVCIQRFAEDLRSGTRISRDQILNGARIYSIEYLLPEIKDELVGTATPDQIDAIFSAISALRSREFKFTDLVGAAKAQGMLDERETRSLISGLYECSAVGTVHSQHGLSYYTFKYRSPHSSFGLGQPLLLHRGIWKAMNVA